MFSPNLMDSVCHSYSLHLCPNAYIEMLKRCGGKMSAGGSLAASLLGKKSSFQLVANHKQRKISMCNQSPSHIWFNRIHLSLLACWFLGIWGEYMKPPASGQTNKHSLIITPSPAELCVEATLVHIHWYGISLLSKHGFNWGKAVLVNRTPRTERNSNLTSTFTWSLRKCGSWSGATLPTIAM